MKEFNRKFLFILLSGLALVLVLFIQVNWLLETARVKEELFNEKANMVLSRTVEALGADKETCMKMGTCCIIDGSEDCKLQLEKSEVLKIDSLLHYYMDFYHFQIKYSFEVMQVMPQQGMHHGLKSHAQPTYVKRLEDVAMKNGVDLQLMFPNKKQFIYAEMGPMFLSSVLLIVLVFVLFLKIIQSLSAEKKVVEHLIAFLNNMTHEFKTPLTNIALATKMLSRQPEQLSEEKHKHYTDIILHENNKLKLQVEQVLGMAALEKGELPMNKQALDAHALIKEVVACMGLQIEEAGGSLQMALNAPHSLIMADKTHMSNALCNLLDNAIKYASEAPQIRVETKEQAKLLLIQISDKGIGIAKEYQQKVFEKFFRVPTGNLHNVKGFGIGLSYVKKVVQLHGGSMELHSEPHKGSTIILQIPLYHG